jgi:hypothetical protein
VEKPVSCGTGIFPMLRGLEEDLIDRIDLIDLIVNGVNGVNEVLSQFPTRIFGSGFDASGIMPHEPISFKTVAVRSWTFAEWPLGLYSWVPKRDRSRLGALQGDLILRFP